MNRYGQVVVYLAFALVVLGVIASRAGSVDVTDEADRLRYTSVYVAPGAERLLDADRARRLIGDRPLVVVARQDGTCDDIAAALPDVIVLLARDDEDEPFVDCGGRDSLFDLDLLRVTLAAMTFVDASQDRTAYVAEYVRAFDARHTAPPRTPPADGLDGQTIGLALLALAIVAVFLLGCGHLFRDVRVRQNRATQRGRTWRAKANARLNRLADLVTRVGEPGRTAAERASVAKEYVLTLREFEAAVTEQQRAGVEVRITGLERLAGVRRVVDERNRRREAERDAPERRAIRQRARPHEWRARRRAAVERQRAAQQASRAAKRAEKSRSTARKRRKRRDKRRRRG